MRSTIASILLTSSNRLSYFQEKSRFLSSNILTIFYTHFNQNVYISAIRKSSFVFHLKEIESVHNKLDDNRVCVSIYATYFYPRSIVTKWTVLRFSDSLSFVEVRRSTFSPCTFKLFRWISFAFNNFKYLRNLEIIRDIIRVITCCFEFQFKTVHCVCFSHKN